MEFITYGYAETTVQRSPGYWISAGLSMCEKLRKHGIIWRVGSFVKREGKQTPLNDIFRIVKVNNIAFITCKSYICITKKFFEYMQNETIGWISLVSKVLPVIGEIIITILFSIR